MNIILGLYHAAKSVTYAVNQNTKKRALETLEQLIVDFEKFELPKRQGFIPGHIYEFHGRYLVCLSMDFQTMEVKFKIFDDINEANQMR